MATATRQSQVREERTVVVTYATFVSTSRLDQQPCDVLTIISIRVVWAATQRGTGDRELHYGEALGRDKQRGRVNFPKSWPTRSIGKSLTPTRFDPAGTACGLDGWPTPSSVYAPRRFLGVDSVEWTGSGWLSG